MLAFFTSAIDERQSIKAVIVSRYFFIFVIRKIVLGLHIIFHNIYLVYQFENTKLPFFFNPKNLFTSNGMTISEYGTNEKVFVTTEIMRSS